MSETHQLYEGDLNWISHLLNSYTGVSKNNGTSKSSILIGFSIINHPFWGTPIFGNTHTVDGAQASVEHHGISWSAYSITPCISTMFGWRNIFWRPNSHKEGTTSLHLQILHTLHRLKLETQACKTWGASFWWRRCFFSEANLNEKYS